MHVVETIPIFESLRRVTHTVDCNDGADQKADTGYDPEESECGMHDHTLPDTARSDHSFSYANLMGKSGSQFYTVFPSSIATPEFSKPQAVRLRM
jgi:hypothetical protein